LNYKGKNESFQSAFDSFPLKHQIYYLYNVLQCFHDCDKARKYMSVQ